MLASDGEIMRPQDQSHILHLLLRRSNGREKRADVKPAMADEIMLVARLGFRGSASPTKRDTKSFAWS